MEFKSTEDVRKAIDHLLSTGDSLKKSYSTAAFKSVRRLLIQLHEQVDRKIKKLDSADIQNPTLKHYKLKGEFLDAFTNLGSGKEFAQKEVFNKPGVPQRKSYADLAECEYHESVLEKLVNLGFVEEIDKGITAVPKGDS